MITNIIITITNPYAPNISESFYYPCIDILDLAEIEYCAEEAMGVFLDEHGDIWNTLDVPFDKIVDSCEYIIEEVSNQ